MSSQIHFAPGSLEFADATDSSGGGEVRLPSTQADIYPGIKGDESLFVEKTADGASIVYLKIAEERKHHHQGYKYQRLASIAFGDVESVAFKNLDGDDKPDVEITVRSRYADMPAEAATHSFQIYQKDFAWESAKLLGVTLNMLYDEAAEFCSRMPGPINELEFPECAPIKFDESVHDDVARSNLEWRVQQLEWDLRRDRTDLRRLQTQKDDLDFRVARLEKTGSEGSQPPLQPSGPASDVPMEDLGSLEFRLQQLEFEERRLASELRFLHMDLVSLEARVRKLEDQPRADAATAEKPAPIPSGLYGDVGDRVDDLESRMDDLESRVDDLENWER